MFNTTLLASEQTTQSGIHHNTNVDFPAQAASIHAKAAEYYQQNKTFSPQGDKESPTAYVLRMLKGYSKVKSKEYDALLPLYNRMFDAYAQETPIPYESITPADYTLGSTAFSVSVTLPGGKVITFKLALTSDKTKLLTQNWKDYAFTLYGVPGYKDPLYPYHLQIKAPDGSVFADGTLSNIHTLFLDTYYEKLVPLSDRTLFLAEPSRSAEFIYNPDTEVMQPSPYHINCTSAISNLTANRLVARSGYKDRKYSLLKWDFSEKAPGTLAAFTDSVADYSSRHNTGLSLDGRLVILKSQDGVWLYSFDTGKRLLKVMDKVNSDGRYYYAFDPFHNRIYIATETLYGYYDIATAKFQPVQANYQFIYPDNSGEHVAIYNETSRSVNLMNLSDSTSVKLQVKTDQTNIFYLKGMDFSPNDRLAAVFFSVNTNANDELTHIYVYDTHTGKKLRSIYAPYVDSIAFTKDGQNILTAASRTHTISLFHLGVLPGELQTK